LTGKGEGSQLGRERQGRIEGPRPRERAKERTRKCEIKREQETSKRRTEQASELEEPF